MAPDVTPCTKVLISALLSWPQSRFSFISSGKLIVLSLDDIFTLDSVLSSINSCVRHKTGTLSRGNVTSRVEFYHDCAKVGLMT